MIGDPVSPVTFERAIRELAHQLSVHAGLDRSNVVEGEQAPSRSALSTEREEQSEGLRDEAEFRVWSLAVIGEIGAWASEGGRFRRVPQEAVRDRLAKPVDEPWGLYVDEAELAYVTAARWPDKFGVQGDSDNAAGGRSRSPLERKRGRRKGDGYSLKDGPTFENILAAQRESGNVETQFALVKRFAGDVNSPSYNANVDRLRKGLPNWLAKNGHEWRSSNFPQIDP